MYHRLSAKIHHLGNKRLHFFLNPSCTTENLLSVLALAERGTNGRKLWIGQGQTISVVYLDSSLLWQPSLVWHSSPCANFVTAPSFRGATFKDAGAQCDSCILHRTCSLISISEIRTQYLKRKTCQVNQSTYPLTCYFTLISYIRKKLKSYWYFDLGLQK